LIISPAYFHPVRHAERPRAGLSFVLARPASPRATAFFDGQNLFHAVKEAFGYTYPNYDVRLLAETVCRTSGWSLHQVRFYTGVPDASDNAAWNHFWTHKLAMLGRLGVVTFSRSLRYRTRVVRLPDGSECSIVAGEEKGIDVRIAVDVIRLAHRRDYDVALVFSQDQDLSEVADEIRVIAKEQDRWIKIACAYPMSPTTRNRRGIDKTDWIPIDKPTYDACVDRRDYRLKSTS
jgi:uncharacterized LabA/DUF88 family protein